MCNSVFGGWCWVILGHKFGRGWVGGGRRIGGLGVGGLGEIEGQNTPKKAYEIPIPIHWNWGFK